MAQANIVWICTSPHELTTRKLHPRKRGRIHNSVRLENHRNEKQTQGICGGLSLIRQRSVDWSNDTLASALRCLVPFPAVRYTATVMMGCWTLTWVSCHEKPTAAEHNKIRHKLGVYFLQSKPEVVFRSRYQIRSQPVKAQVLCADIFDLPFDSPAGAIPHRDLVTLCNLSWTWGRFPEKRYI